MPDNDPRRTRKNDLPTQVTVHHAGSCAACTKPLPRGVTAFYVRGVKALVCVECTQLEAYPMSGEHLLGRVLDELAAEGRIEVLHDRVIPGSRSAIAHIVIGPRRITVIDVKHHPGATIRTKRVRGDRVLLIDDEDATRLVEQVRAQCAALRSVLGADHAGSVEGTIAFVGANPGSLGTDSCRGIACMNVTDAVARAAFGGSFPGSTDREFEAGQRVELRDLIAAALPPGLPR